MKVNQLQISGNIFRRPKYSAPSAWHAHVPFMLWLVSVIRPKNFVELGTHFGVSYFSACQSVADLEIQCACYAIDSWKGDSQAGFYDESVYESVRKYNDENYRAFSSLIRSDFEAAVSGFEDSSVDLLHLDGHHSYESVSKDFENWFPKLSESAVVIMHDTNVREKNFGVHKFYSEISKKYKSFEFIHGHGLAVVLVGKETKHRSEFQELRKICGTKQALQDARDLFSLLGEGAENRWKLSAAQDELVKRRKEVSILRARNKEALETKGA
ncbi:class I SAM-dependent methyltransferase [Roseateles sp. BYS180W]|uniref:Class I SAM-dependent methyltransferase n=1 Tax=Roseateles rivi TaxID=3299028 RepID=A0ABW7FYJ4_9BURK